MLIKSNVVLKINESLTSDIKTITWQLILPSNATKQHCFRNEGGE